MSKAKRGLSAHLRLRLPVNLHKSLTKDAESNQVSLNTYMINLLAGNHGFMKGSLESCHQAFHASEHYLLKENESLRKLLRPAKKESRR